MALTRAKLEELIAAGEIEVGGGGVNPNLLHNSDFRNPVNQRGVSGAISTGTYFFDRWMRNSGTVTVNVGYLTLASGAVVEQRIEGNLLAGVICTVSFEVGSTIYHGSGVFPTNNGTVSVEVDGYPNITFGCATGYMFVLIPATSNISIKRFKCEMGFVSTLHLDPPMDWAVELPKCQRYFIMLGSVVPCFGFTNSATDASMSIPLPATLRIATPSLYVSGSSYLFTQNGEAIFFDSFYDARSLPGMLYFRVTVSGGLTTSSSVNGYLAASGIAYVSADL